ncbi:MAG: type II toxin-antitoxin system RelE/ParE family toxin [Rhodovibrio sp.]|nr:type II toxin-antitoxin system RelE/ParE family toxin [Rhodovibrio sp.]
MRIVSVRHKGLRKLLETGEVTGIRRDLVRRVRNAIMALRSAASIEEVQTTPGMRVHKLSGRREGTWSAAVSGNWRLTFELDGDEIYNLDLEDYH